MNEDFFPKQRVMRNKNSKTKNDHFNYSLTLVFDPRRDQLRFCESHGIQCYSIAATRSQTYTHLFFSLITASWQNSAEKWECSQVNNAEHGMYRIYSDLSLYQVAI